MSASTSRIDCPGRAIRRRRRTDRQGRNEPACTALRGQRRHLSVRWVDDDRRVLQQVAPVPPELVVGARITGARRLVGVAAVRGGGVHSGELLVGKDRLVRELRGAFERCGRRVGPDPCNSGWPQGVRGASGASQPAEPSGPARIRAAAKCPRRRGRERRRTPGSGFPFQTRTSRHVNTALAAVIGAASHGPFKFPDPVTDCDN